MVDNTRVSFAKLNNGNYVAWKFRMKALLEREELWDVIVAVKPEEVDEQYAQWKKSDVKARATISLFIEDSQLRFVKKAETACDMWNNLMAHHEKATLSTQAMLLKQLVLINLEVIGDIEKYLERIENVFDRLDSSGVEISEQLRVIMLLRSLPRSYANFVTTLENRPDVELTMDLVVARLRSEYERQTETKAGPSGISVKEEKVHKADANVINDKKCFFCKKPGHFKRNCRKLTALKNDKSSGESSKKSGSEQQQQAKKVQTENAQRQKPSVANDPYSGAVCFVAGGAIPGAWVIDSGCTCHMTNDREFFVEYKRDVVVDVTLADGTKTKSCGIGSGNVIGIDGNGKRIKITLERVLHVPTLEGGLISVRKLAEKGFTVVFKVNDCEIRDSEDNVIAVGEMAGSQYKLKITEHCTVVKGSHTDLCQHTWHRRFGHRDVNVMNIITSKGLVSGFKVKDCEERIVCECCIKGKLARKPFPPLGERRSTQLLDLVHTDLCGPMENVTPSGNKYFITLIDDHSRFCAVFLLKSKNEAEPKIREYVRWTENVFGRKPKVIRSDGGGEYIGESLQQFYKAEGIAAQYTTPYTPQQNGVAERKNRALQEMANCMLLDAGLPKCYWGEAVVTANYVQNRLPSRVVDKTPFELWTGRVPDLSELKVFGCEAYVHVPDQKRKKFDAKARKLVFVGYSTQHKGYRFLDLLTNRISISRDARFLELGNGSEQVEKLVDSEVLQIPEEHSDDNVSDCEEEIILDRKSEDEVLDEEEPSEYDDASEMNESDFLGFEPEVPEEQVVLNRADRRTRGVLPGRFEDYVVGQVIVDEEPKDYKEAMLVSQWKSAMNAEIAAHTANQTWELMSLPPGKKVIGVKWVFKIKRDEAGKIVKHKARIVAKGYTQSFGIDFTEVYAPVTRQATLRVLLAVASKQGLLLKQYDFKTAYLNGTINEELYMSQPPGYSIEGKEDMVCRLRKSIYGLRQSARCWNRTLHAVLLDLGFEACESDPCLYVRRGKSVVYLVVYVDDLIVGSADEKEIDEVFRSLKDKFDVTSLGQLRHFLGYEIERVDGCYSLRLTPYIECVLRKFQMGNSHPVKTPIDLGYTAENDESKPFEDTTLYRSLIGALLYLAVNARPDVALSVGLLGRKVSEPNNSDWNAAKRILQYLNGTKDLKLSYGSQNEWNLVGYSDSDWAGDRRTRRSTTGFIFFYGGGPVSWMSKGQNSVALSSLEAEYNALSLACQEVMWLRRLLEELGEPETNPTIVFEDNMGCLSFAKAERCSGRVKHIDTKRHFIRDLCEKKTVDLKYCSSEEMVADALTKPVGPAKLNKFLKRIELIK